MREYNRRVIPPSTEELPAVVPVLTLNGTQTIFIKNDRPSTYRAHVQSVGWPLDQKTIDRKGS